MKNKITENQIKDLYEVQRLSVPEIADILNLCVATVRYYLKKFGIENRLKIEKFRLNELFFETWSPNMAYCLGFIVADGSIQQDYRLRIEINRDDVEILEFLKENLESNQTIKYRSRFDKRTGNTYHSCFFYCDSKKLIESLSSLGVVKNKTGKEVYPNVPEEFKYDFLRGFLDGDGTIVVKQVQRGNKHLGFNLAFASASKEFLEEINKNLLFGYGSIYKKKGCDCYSLSIKDRQRIKEILDLVYNGNFCLDRKFEKFTKLLIYHDQQKDNAMSKGILASRAKKSAVIKQANSI